MRKRSYPDPRSIVSGKPLDFKPHRQRYFKLSTDPFFVEKTRDIVWLYLNLPDKAMVASVTEKSQIQALNRTHPLVPTGLDYVEVVIHDYVRHGTSTSFDGLDIATDQIFIRWKHHHRHQEYLNFLKHVHTSAPQDLGMYLVVDNHSTHMLPRVKHGPRLCWHHSIGVGQASI
jgi:putative transposase